MYVPLRDGDESGEYIMFTNEKRKKTEIIYSVMNRVPKPSGKLFRHRPSSPLWAGPGSSGPKRLVACGTVTGSSVK